MFVPPAACRSLTALSTALCVALLLSDCSGTTTCVAVSNETIASSSSCLAT